MKLFAPAKVNLGLSVLAKRDDGYHDLSTVMAPLSVGDSLTVTPAADLRLEVRGAKLPTGEGNLVYRAARVYLDAVLPGAGVHITLHKTLPLSSGLGGGSSDAATTLLALARLYPAAVDLMALARTLGADVPFFLLGGAALAEGTGDRLTPLTLERLHLVLLNPAVAISARDAYAWLTCSDYTPPLKVPALLSALNAGQGAAYFNTLQAGALLRHPQVAEALSALQTAGLHSPLMSGSGSTVFALAHSQAQAQAAAQALSQRFPGFWVQAAHTI